MWNCEITLFSYLFHIIFILFSHFGARDPGLGPKAAARGPGRAWPAAALGPGPGFRAPKCENNMKIIWKKYENNVISQFHIIFTFYSYYFHIFITFWGSGPRSGPQKSYFCHIPGHIIFILFSYFGICLGWAPCPFRNLWKWCWAARCASLQICSQASRLADKRCRGKGVRGATSHRADISWKIVLNRPRTVSS